MQTSKRRKATRAATPILLVVHLSLFFSLSAKAEIREPDNVLYGAITLDNLPVTAERKDVVIEARRSDNQAAVASYRMGTNPRLGNYYALEIPLESVAPVTEPNASQTGETLSIIVTDASGRRGQTTYLLGERGAVQRVDFGTALPDSDADGLPDAWELLRFGNLSQNGSSMVPNGLTARQNFIYGTDPLSTNGLLKLNISVSNNQEFVSFLALRAEGAGYEGKSRFYSLERATSLTATSWAGVANLTNVLGNNQTLLFQTPNTNAPAFYRGLIWLEGP